MCKQLNQIVYWSDHPTILFAAGELRRLMKNVGAESVICNHGTYANDGDHTNIHLMTTNIYHHQLNMKERLMIKDDGFAFVRSGHHVWIVGNEPRSVLYGVYKYCSNRFGYQWIQLGEEAVSTKVKQTINQKYIHEPMFKRRGNVIETVNDPIYINSLVDWGVKNGQNEYFFTFFLWDQIKEYVAPELMKRDVHVTLGGHSLSYLLKEIQSACSAEDLVQDSKLKFFSENEQMQEKVVDQIISVCQENKVVTRISLWPEDKGIAEKDVDGFLNAYIRFTEKIKNALEKNNLPVEVEHIVYNAGLSWEMLERDDQTIASAISDVLYAYWGRDYSAALDSKQPNQVRAYRSLKDWNHQSALQGKSLTVFEYYSDHFMLSELFPPLLMRIKQDLQDYQAMNICGVLNLIVPLHKKQQYPEIEDYYPWKWIHHLNNYMYARLSWGETYEDIIEDYFAQFEEDQHSFYEEIIQLEALISQHTKWNRSLFPARIVDPEIVAEKAGFSEISTYLKEIEDFLLAYDFSEIEPLINIQTDHTDELFTTKEMMLIYFYYLKQIARLYAEEWR